MKIRDIKIRTQLIFAFIIILLFFILLGANSYKQTNLIEQQTKLLYNHPFKVKQAISMIKIDVLNVRLGMRDFLLAKTEMERQNTIHFMDSCSSNIEVQFDVLYSRYSGKREDIDEIRKAYDGWNKDRKEDVRLALAGEPNKIMENIFDIRTVKEQRNHISDKINIVDDFATKEGDYLFKNSQTLKEKLNAELTLMLIGIILLTILINYFLIKNIRKPIKKLTEAAKRFHDGDLSARSSIKAKNEFSELSFTYNEMVESIQTSTDMNKKLSNIAQQMLIEEDAHKFFQSLFPVLADITNSQMVAVYLLSEDKQSYFHYESIGLVDEIAKKSFAADKFEGEFGSVLSTRKIQSVKNIPLETRFVFQTVSGQIIPREIITIPIISATEIVAIISLASVRNYTDSTNLLIQNVYNTLSARIEGVLTYRKVKDFSIRLELQNNKLEAQKTELSFQSKVLQEQNTELEMQKKQLNEANQLKTTFLSNMSHELRTPLNSVIALSGVLNRRLADKIPADEYSYLEVIERNGKHLLSLINDILDISRIEAGREEIEITRINTNNLIAEIMSMIQPQAQQKKIVLQQIHFENEIIISTDADKCRHILQNLIGNAVKFTEKGKVEVASYQSDNSVNITVSDTGIGISEKNISHIFDEFRQADGSTSRKFGGTGLGLAIAKKYANLLGGKISVASIPTKGSIFTLTLPIHYSTENVLVEAAEPNNILQTISNESTLDCSGKTILLVEDSEPAIIQIKDFLEESGYKIIIARNGKEALDIIYKVIPDAIILDLMMPGIDGFEVLQTIRKAELTAHIPVLILTAKHITKDEFDFLKEYNVHQLIQKGDINRVTLLNSVANLVFTETDKSEKKQLKLQKTEKKPSVLIVEDNLDNMITVKALIEDKFTILEAIDGKQGVSMAKMHIPDLILIDIELPEMDGIEAFKIIRNDGKLAHIPVVVLTASALTTEREAILAHGFDAYLAKPIDEKIFFKTINEVLYGK